MWIFLRSLVSAALLALLLWRVGPAEFLRRVAGADAALLAAAAAPALMSVVLNARRWQLLLAVQGVNVPLPRLFSAHLVGLFFNNFLPTVIGGDVLRAREVSRGAPRSIGAEAAASVLVERLLAALALAATAAVGLVFSYRVAGPFAASIAGLLAAAAAAVALLSVGKWRRAATGLAWLPERSWLRRSAMRTIEKRTALNDFSACLATCLGDRRNLAVVAAYSAASQLLVVGAAWVVFLSLGVNVSLVYCVLVIPVITALQMFPVSAGGFGVREGAYVYFFGAVGVSGAEAVSASLLYWALIAVVSLPGGVIFALRLPRFPL